MSSYFLWGATCLEGTELGFQFSNTRLCIPSQGSFLTGTLLGLEAGLFGLEAGLLGLDAVLLSLNATLLGLETSLLGLETSLLSSETGLLGFAMGQKFLPCLRCIKMQLAVFHVQFQL
jgi:hypothetical protein